ncbi:isochorismatase family protein [Nitrospirillum viridazoti]|uniref:Isochorismatase n=1 Tax=Nitrospirillum viridazoti CBAmc TaxID=1441467 RepID=A0A248JVT0_9PROT|nr:isochorismatase family protein [Nitrospirillum amazonense]ASG22689.1 isochorismatase [Nitrospirillum amazonense CBAmc]
MPRLDPRRSTLAVIDLQARLMPAIQGGSGVVANTRRLLATAALLDIPALFTEQNPRGLGATVPELAPDASSVIAKMTFDATPAPGFLDRLPPDHAVVLTGCETHVCVLQTALGLLERGRRVCVVEDAVGSRTVENKAAGLRRLAAEGAEIITTEMAVFEWLESAEHPRFRKVIALIK